MLIIVIIMFMIVIMIIRIIMIKIMIMINMIDNASFSIGSPSQAREIAARMRAKSTGVVSGLPPRDNKPLWVYEEECLPETTNLYVIRLWVSEESGKCDANTVRAHTPHTNTVGFRRIR